MKKLLRSRGVSILLAVMILMNMFSTNVFAMSDAEVAEILARLSVEEQFEWLEDHPEVDWNLEMGEIMNNPNARVVDENRIYYTKQATSSGGEGWETWLSYTANYIQSVHSNNPSTTIAVESVRISNVTKSCPYADRYTGPTATYGSNTAAGYASSMIVGGVQCNLDCYELMQTATLLPNGTTNIKTKWYLAS